MAEIRLEDILVSRERRWNKRIELSKRCESLISISLCVPMLFRGGKKEKDALRNKCVLIEKLLVKEGFPIEGREELDGADGLTVYLLSKGDERLKRFCVELEETLPNGRLLDIDVTSKTPLGRKELGLQPRKCFICQEPAAECVSAERHSRLEIAHFIENCGFTDS